MFGTNTLRAFIFGLSLLLWLDAAISINEHVENTARYDNYRYYKVQVNNLMQLQLLKDINSASIMVFGTPAVNRSSHITVAPHSIPQVAELLQMYEYEYEVLSYNYQEQIDASLAEVLPKDMDVSYVNWQQYMHLETIYNWMEHLCEQHPDRVTLLNMGTSTHGLPIKGVKIGKNAKNKAIFIESGIHPQEWIAPATATYIINELLFSNATGIQNLAEHYNWLIFPVVNPDGYKYTFETNRLWRKNRQNYGICTGVDLNRNFPLGWAYKSDECSSSYSGPYAGSEVETQRIIAFVEKNLAKEQIKTYLSLHSFSQYILYPYGYTAEQAENFEDLNAIAAKAAKSMFAVHGEVYTIGSFYDQLYLAGGVSADWAYGIQGIPISYTLELRGVSGNDQKFLLPASEIEPNGEELLAGIQTIVEEAQARGYYD